LGTLPNFDFLALRRRYSISTVCTFIYFYFPPKIHYHSSLQSPPNSFQAFSLFLFKIHLNITHLHLAPPPPSNVPTKFSVSYFPCILFLAFSPEGGVGLVPKRGCLLTLPYYAFPRWYEFGQRRWNDIDRGKQKNSEKILSQCHFSHHNTTWVDPGANPGIRGERPATNDLRHGTAFLFWLRRP
jgi:hypothetical protein